MITGNVYYRMKQILAQKSHFTLAFVSLTEIASERIARLRKSLEVRTRKNKF